LVSERPPRGGFGDASDLPDRRPSPRRQAPGPNGSKGAAKAVGEADSGPIPEMLLRQRDVGERIPNVPATLSCTLTPVILSRSQLVHPLAILARALEGPPHPLGRVAQLFAEGSQRIDARLKCRPVRIPGRQGSPYEKKAQGSPRDRGSGPALLAATLGHHPRIAGASASHAAVPDDLDVLVSEALLQDLEGLLLAALNDGDVAGRRPRAGRRTPAASGWCVHGRVAATSAC